MNTTQYEQGTEVDEDINEQQVPIMNKSNLNFDPTRSEKMGTLNDADGESENVNAPQQIHMSAVPTDPKQAKLNEDIHKVKERHLLARKFGLGNGCKAITGQTE